MAKYDFDVAKRITDRWANEPHTELLADELLAEMEEAYIDEDTVTFADRVVYPKLIASFVETLNFWKKWGHTISHYNGVNLRDDSIAAREINEALSRRDFDHANSIASLFAGVDK